MQLLCNTAAPPPSAPAINRAARAVDEGDHSVQRFPW